MTDKTILDVCSDLLVTRLTNIYADDDDRFAERIAQLAELSAERRIICLATYQALFELAASSGAADLSEEHQTAAFMGQLATNLAWFSVIGAASSKDPICLPCISWGYHTRSDEAVWGADFAIVRHLSTDNQSDCQDRVRVILIQAKKAAAKDYWEIKVDQVSSKTSKSEFDNPALLQRRDGVNELLDSARNKKVTLKVVTKELAKQETAGKVHLQLESLLLSDQIGRRVNPLQKDWCFYVAWFPGASTASKMAEAFPLSSVAAQLSAWDSKNPKPPAISLSGDLSMAKLLCNVLASEPGEAAYGLEAPLKDVSELLGTLAMLLPGLRLVLASDDGEGMRSLELAVTGWKIEPTVTINAEIPYFVPAPGPTSTLGYGG